MRYVRPLDLNVTESSWMESSAGIPARSRSSGRFALAPVSGNLFVLVFLRTSGIQRLPRSRFLVARSETDSTLLTSGVAVDRLQADQRPRATGIATIPLDLYLRLARIQTAAQ